MGLEALATVLAQLAVAVLRWWAGREDLRRTERQRLLIGQLGLEQAALEWTVAAMHDPARAALLRVRGSGTPRLEDFQPAAGADRGASSGDVQPGR